MSPTQTSPHAARILCACFLLSVLMLHPSPATGHDRNTVATFSIVARDPSTGELGVGVASRFFAVGSVVPWAKSGIGAVATQARANTSYGWRGLDLLEQGATPAEAGTILLRNDAEPDRRQFGIVAADGKSFTYTGKNCVSWAGGRSGENYAVQGNILAGEGVVAAMESTFVNTTGTLADRIYASLLAGDARGGDSRGKQSAAMLIVKDRAGYGGFTDRAIDIHVDDHPEPFTELGRLLDIAQTNYSWNEAWTFFTNGHAQNALAPMERTAQRAPQNPEVLYDLAVIRLSNGLTAKSLEALEKALTLNPQLEAQARADTDLAPLRNNPQFKKLVHER
jgi:uncharacterized Ntn-hydrolase superfamily protein